MSDDATEPGEAPIEGHSALVSRLMKKQAALSLRVAAVFILILIGLPLFNFYRPAMAGTSEYGFTLTWLFLGVLFFPVTWILSAYFVSKSDALENQICVDEAAHKVSHSADAGAQS